MLEIIFHEFFSWFLLYHSYKNGRSEYFWILCMVAYGQLRVGPRLFVSKKSAKNRFYVKPKVNFQKPGNLKSRKSEYLRLYSSKVIVFLMHYSFHFLEHYANRRVTQQMGQLLPSYTIVYYIMLIYLEDFR